MSEFLCPATFECRRICDALASQGLKAVGSHEELCKSPSYFTEKDGQICANIPEGEEVKNPVLAKALLEALHPLIAEQTPVVAEVLVLKDEFKTVHDTRILLWTAMGNATQERREFTDVEAIHYQAEIAAQQRALNETSNNASPETILQAQAAFDYETMKRDGIVFDDQALRVLDRLAANGMEGKSTLLVGDKGIAKTQLARYMATFLSAGNQPVFLSGHGDQTADEFIGRDYQDPETGMFVFKHGKLIDAMKQGLPVVIDEINLADQSITMRLQDILLRKPGDKIVLHENGNEEIEIAPGFVVFATANEASERYRHRVVLDPAFRDRFDIVNLFYPDRETESAMLDTPATTMRLALAAASDENGSISRYISSKELEMVARVAHVTQRLYSTPLENVGNLGDLDLGTSTTQYLSSDKPIMTDCLTPRSMVTILQRCARGNKAGFQITEELEKTIRALDQGGSQVNSTYAEKIMEFYR